MAVVRIVNFRVRINANDHPPPHFYVLLNDGREAWVTIAELKIVHGKVAVREIAEALAWAEKNCATLAATFEDLQR